MKLIRILKRQTPMILTFIGATGVVATSVLAVRSTPKALKLCEELKKDVEEPTKMDYVACAWKCYIPSIAVGTATIVCILGAGILNKRQQTALASAYIFLDRSYKEYREKVAEMIGKENETNIRCAIAKDKCENADYHPNGEVLLFYEENYGSYFERTMLEVREAEYQLNKKFASEGEAALNDFFEYLALETTTSGEILGWIQEECEECFDSNNPRWIEFEHELVKMEDGMECYLINILDQPEPVFLPF